MSEPGKAPPGRADRFSRGRVIRDQEAQWTRRGATEGEALVVSIQNRNVISSEVEVEVEAAVTEISRPHVVANAGPRGGLLTRMGDPQIFVFGDRPLEWERLQKLSTSAGFNLFEELVDLILNPFLEFINRDAQLLVREAIGVKGGGRLRLGSAVFVPVPVERRPFGGIVWHESHPGLRGKAI